MKESFEFEWGVYAQSASEAIFRARTYNKLIQSGDHSMNETRRKPTTGRQSPSLFDRWHGIFCMPSCTDTAGHSRAFDNPVTGHLGGSRSVQFREWDSNQQHIGSQSNVLLTEPARFSLIELSMV